MHFRAPFYSHRDHFITHRIIRAANVPAFVQMTVSFGWTANGNRILYFSTLKITIFALVTSLDVCLERYNECAKLSMVLAKCENEHLWFFFLLSFYLGLKETKQQKTVFFTHFSCPNTSLLLISIHENAFTALHFGFETVTFFAFWLR